MPDSILLSRPCVKCGSTDRKSNGSCRACAKAYDTAYRAANHEKVKAASAVWRLANRDKARARTAAWAASNTERKKATNAVWYASNVERRKATNAVWFKANTERTKATTAAWGKANRELKRIHWQNREAKKRANGGILSKGLSAKLFKLQHGKCACCGLPLGGNFHLDHILPIALGGVNADSNIQLLRSTCNQQKSAKHPIDFMQSRGFLL